MGNIQNAINQGIATVGTTIALGGHLAEQKKQTVEQAKQVEEQKKQVIEQARQADELKAIKEKQTANDIVSAARADVESEQLGKDIDKLNEQADTNLNETQAIIDDYIKNDDIAKELGMDINKDKNFIAHIKSQQSLTSEILSKQRLKMALGAYSDTYLDSATKSVKGGKE